MDACLVIVEYPCFPSQVEYLVLTVYDVYYPLDYHCRTFLIEAFVHGISLSEPGAARTLGKVTSILLGCVESM